MLQNYAKFNSNIVEDEIMQKSLSFDSIRWSSYSSSNSIFNFFWDIIDLLSDLLMAWITIFWIFLFLYIIISLFSKWGEKTWDDLKNISNWTINLIKNIFWWAFNLIKKIFSYFYNRKTISISIIVILVLINFTSNVIDWNSKILKLSKINSWYVWVDLKNNDILNPWYHLYSPIKTNFFLSPTNNFDFEIAEVTANTKEDLWVTLDYRVWFKLKNDARLDFYNTYWAKNIRLVASDVVMPRLLETIKWIIRDYGFREISSKHNEIKNITISEANKILSPIWIELQDITILDIRLPKSYLASKEDLLKSENELKLAEARLEAQKKESEKKIIEAENSKKIRIIEAEAIAEYNKIITSEKISEDAIEMKKLEIQKLKIEKWDWKMPTTINWWFDL